MTISSQAERVRPAALQPGDTVGIIAPASGFRRDELEAGCAELLRLGYQPFYLPSIFERALYFAGTPERRVHELHEMFRRPEVKAILCARGGYGSNYLLPDLDLELIRANPKIFVGCSDVTTLLTYLCDAARLVTFHGPMVAGDLARPGGVDEDSWLTALSSGKTYERRFDADEVQPLAQGNADGVLYGGCLSLLVASLGTPYEMSTKGTILFLEDRAERPYRIDRMLMQLKLAGKFDGIQGIIFGEMIDCAEPGTLDYTLQQIVMRILADLRIPVAFGLKSGHVSSGSITLPFGVRAKLSVGETVSFSYEPAVVRQQAEFPRQSMGGARS
jgi:muramoyltetrapeptide carboxypeptidase